MRRKNHILFIFSFMACEIISAQNIVANFSFDTTVCFGGSTCFHDLSISNNGPITTWNWDFGDASTPWTYQDPCHTYSSPGTFTVTLIVTNSNGDKDTVQHPVIVHPLPVASFAYSANGDTINFITANPPDCFYFWDFGDGDTSIVQMPQHVYSANGTYTVCHTVTTCFNCSATTCQQINITTKVSETEISSSIIIYSNPSNGLFRITSSRFKIQDLKIYTLMGELVFQKQMNSQFETLNSNLPAGVYYLHLHINAKNIVKKLIVQNISK